MSRPAVPSRRRAVVAGLAVLVVAAGGAGGACGGDSTEDATSDGPAADALATTVDGLEGGTVQLVDPDRTTVVAFVASWCVPCRRELPELQQKATEMGDDVRVVAVAVQEEPAQTRGLVADTGITFPVGSDPDGVVLSDYGFTGLPGTMLLDGDGTVLHRYRGTIDFDDLDRRLAAASS